MQDSFENGIEGRRDEDAGDDRHHGSGNGGQVSDLLAALNALARGQEHLDARNGQILSRLDAVTLIQQQLTERVCDRIDALPIPPDIRDELIAMRDEVRRQGRGVDALQALPTHRPDMPDVLAKGLAAAVQGQLRPAVQAMEAMPADVRRGVADIDRIVQGARTRCRQNRWLGVVAAASLLAGFGALSARCRERAGRKPSGSVGGRHKQPVAGGLGPHGSRSGAGAAILGAMRDLYNQNHAALQACSQAVAVKHREQTCSVVMDVPLPAPLMREVVTQ